MFAMAATSALPAGLTTRSGTVAPSATHQYGRSLSRGADGSPREPSHRHQLNVQATASEYDPQQGRGRIRAFDGRKMRCGTDGCASVLLSHFALPPRATAAG